MVFQIGCELHWSWRELIDMPLQDLEQYYEWLIEKKQEEEKQLEKSRSRNRQSSKPVRRGGRFRRR